MPVELDDETTYYVQVVDANHIRLALAPSIALSYIRSGPAGPAVTHTLGKLEIQDFTQSQISGDLITVPGGHHVIDGTLVTYLGTYSDPPTPDPAIPAPVTVDPVAIGTFAGRPNTIHIVGHPFATGDGVVDHTTGTPIAGLVDGGTYVVERIDADHIRLSRLDPATRSLVLVPLVSAVVAGTHTFETYRGIIGLDQGRVYVARVVSPTQLRLERLDPAGEPVHLFTHGAGTHAFLYEVTVAAFDPEVAVSSTSNTITFATDHGLETGDLVVYRTDRARPTYTTAFPPIQFDRGITAISSTALTVPGDRTGLLVAGAAVTGIVNGASFASTVASWSFDATSDLTTIVLATDAIATDADIERVAIELRDTTTGQPLAATWHDNPVGGLDDGRFYYVVKVDARTIRLTSSKEDAEKAKPLDLNQAVDARGHVLAILGNAHSLTTNGCPSGVCILSSLSGYNGINAGSTISDRSGSTADGIIGGLTGGFGNAEEAIGIGKAIKTALSSAADKRFALFVPDEVKPGSDFGATGSIAINFAHHVVETIVGDAARVDVPAPGEPRTTISSDAGISISASISDTAVVAVAASTTKEEADEAAVAVSIAVGVAIFENTARVIIGRFATLDANGDTSISAEVAYPLQLSNGATPINPAEFMKSPDAWSYVNDGTMGYSSNLFNTTVLTSASGAKTSVGGSVAINFYTNVTEARVRAGALINQDHDDRYRGGTQGVAVSARTAMQTVGVVGVGSLGLNIAGGKKAFQQFFKGEGEGRLQRVGQPVRRGRRRKRDRRVDPHRRDQRHHDGDHRRRRGRPCRLEA